MKLKLTFTPAYKVLCLPIHYNYLLQSMIYRNLEKALATWLHEDGFYYLKRRFKLFTFSKLLGKCEIEGKNIIFHDRVYFKVSSPYIKMLESLAEHLVKNPYIRIGEERCVLESAEVEVEREFKERLIIKTISPITIYSTFKTLEGRKKTYYYTPFEPEFSKLIIENLIKKRIAFEKNSFSFPEGAYLRPIKVNNKKNFHILFFKGTVIKAWSGIYELSLPESYMRFAYYAGLGAKNSQGFGMWEVVKTATNF
jgi:CRISPR-associated endoribonuclease Cas6